MTLVPTHKISPSTPLTQAENDQVYCGLDCCVTLEVFEELDKLFPQKPLVYDFERALQGPYLEIMQRGFAVDQLSRASASAALLARITSLQGLLNDLARAVWDRGLNPRSPAQLKEFLYEAMQLPEVWLSQKGEKKLSTNREALEKLDTYLYARPFVQTILRIRDLAKQRDVFETEIDPDNRWRASYNIAGTETGRPSSSQNAFGTGGNQQNISPSLRYVFVADRGYRLYSVDLEQVEARDVGFFCGCLFNDWSFLDACESGDLHTNNAKRIWPELPWTGNNKADRAVAEIQFYREFSYRDMAKRGSHLSNYMGTAWTASRNLKVPLAIMEEFQARYIKGREADPSKGLSSIEGAFPCIAQWWQWTATQLQTKQALTTAFGRQRHFFGRPGDDTTLREAIAFQPQGTTADRMNLGLWRVWKAMPQVQLLAQGFDSITFQVEERYDPDEIVEEVLELIRVELRSPSGRRFVVPGEAKIGYNWGAFVGPEDVSRAVAKGLRPPRLNPGGLIKWKKGQKDQRTRLSGLQRLVG